MPSGKTLQQLAVEIERRAAAKKDLVAPTGKLELVSADDGSVSLNVGSDQKFSVNGVAHDQIGTFTGIPAKYYDRMRAQNPALLAQNVNAWLHASEEKRMVRTLDGTVRAFLSDRYRPLENEDLAAAVLPVIQSLDLEVVSSEITERRFYLKVVDKSVVRELAKTGNAFGDGQHKIIKMRHASPAITISNSEVGLGALSVLGGLYDGFCSNLATFGERSVRKYHVGARHDMAGEEIYSILSTEARQATDRATWLQIGDVVKAAFDRAKFDQLVDKVTGTAANKIDDVVETVNLASKRFGFNEAEGKSVLQHLIQGGELSQFGLYNAVTRTAQDLEDYDRATEFEATGGKIIELAPTEWRELAKAA